MAETAATSKMPTNTKIMILVVVLIIAGVLIWYFTKDDKKDSVTNTTTNTKTGLAGLNLGGLFGGIFGKTGNDKSTVTGDMGTKPADEPDETMQALIAAGAF